MEVIWHGHSCFELRGREVTIMFDPFGGIGLPEPKTEADVVLCSHSHRDHNNVKTVSKEGTIVLEEFIGTREVEGILVRGITSFHDEEGGSRRGMNSIYTIQLNNLSFCHLGDLGHNLSVKHIDNIGEVDVLFAPIGGGPTIGPSIASSIVERLDPKIVVPMHYNAGIPGMLNAFSRFYRVDDFIKKIVKPNVEWIENASFNITKEGLPKERKIIVPTLII